MRKLEVSPGGDGHYYTSVHQWKPVTPDRFAYLLHLYATQDENVDNYGNGRISTKSFQLDKTVTAVIHYARKGDSSPISFPVLMTMVYGGDKPRTVCFSSISYGFDVEDDRARSGIQAGLFKKPDRK